MRLEENGIIRANECDAGDGDKTRGMKHDVDDSDKIIPQLPESKPESTSESTDSLQGAEDHHMATTSADIDLLSTGVHTSATVVATPERRKSKRRHEELSVTATKKAYNRSTRKQSVSLNT